MRLLTTSTVGSPFASFPTAVVHAGLFQASSYRERHRLPRAYAFPPGNDDTGDNSKSHLGNDEPDPVDALIENRVHDSEYAVNHARPNDWPHEAAKQDRPPGKHWQH